MTTNVGPFDARKNDHRLKEDVIAELASDPAIDGDVVGVAVKDGVVTLSGHLGTYAEKQAIENALRRTRGVRAIALELDVKLSALHRRNDTDLALAIEHLLKWNTLVPHDRVRVTVERGWVTLRGEVDWDYERSGLEKAVRPLIGVTGLSNEITLKHRAVPADLNERIEKALERQARRESRQVQVTVDGSTVTLRGHVHSWPEREAAGHAAWAAPGVRDVVNELRVAG